MEQADTTAERAGKVQVRRLLGQFWTAANLLSLTRLVLVVPITYLILIDGPLLWIFGLVFLGAVTDFFDGRVARWSNTVSEWGKVLDPLADKVAGAMIVMALAVRGTLPLWFLALLVVRDVLIVVGGVMIARRLGQVTMSLYIGKVAVTALFATVLAGLLKADPPVMAFCVWVTTVLMVVSWGLYLRRGLRLLRDGAPPEPVQGEESEWHAARSE